MSEAHQLLSHPWTLVGDQLYRASRHGFPIDLPKLQEKLSAAEEDARAATAKVGKWVSDTGWYAWAARQTKVTTLTRKFLGCDDLLCSHRDGRKQRPTCYYLAQVEEVVPSYPDGDDWFNPASAPQLQALLYDLLQLPIPPVTKAGPNRDNKRTTDVGALEYLRDIRGCHDLDLLLNLRKISRVKEFASSWLQVGQAWADGSFRLHPTFRRGTTTGRLSCSNPNLQQVPANDYLSLRECFIPLPGCKLVVADYSALEYRIMAHIHIRLFGDRKLAENLDTIHEQVAVAAFGKRRSYMEGVKPEEVKDHPDKRVRNCRKAAKSVGFGANYGISASALGVQVRDDQGNPIGKTAGQQLLDDYFEFLPAMRKYHEWMEERVMAGKLVPTLGGRLIPVDATRAGVRAGLNIPLQGGGADIMDEAMILLDKRLAGMAQLVSQVHDELVFIVPERESEECAKIVKETMESAWPRLTVPLKAEVKVVDNWGQAK